MLVVKIVLVVLQPLQIKLLNSTAKEVKEKPIATDQEFLSSPAEATVAPSADKRVVAPPSNEKTVAPPIAKTRKSPPAVENKATKTTEQASLPALDKNDVVIKGAPLTISKTDSSPAEVEGKGVAPDEKGKEMGEDDDDEEEETKEEEGNKKPKQIDIVLQPPDYDLHKPMGK